MYKIPDQVVEFIEKTMQTWRVEMTKKKKDLAEVKIQRSIFQGDALSPFLFVIAMMPFNHIRRKCTAGYKLSKSQDMMNDLMNMDDIKLFAQNEEELEIIIQTVRIYSKDIGMEFVIGKCAILVMKSGKQHLTEGDELLIKVLIRTLG